MGKAARGKKNNVFVCITEDLSEFLNDDFLSNIVGKFQTVFDKTGKPSAARSIINVVILKVLQKKAVNVSNLPVSCRVAP